MPLSGIYKDKDLEEFYKTGEDEEERIPETLIRRERPEPEQKERVVVIRKRDAAPRMEEDEVESLERLSPEIIGSLFDRVKFLKERIDEMQEMMRSREEIHKDMVREIEADIAEKDAMVGRIADMEDRRNVKLDISVLRKEKRSEIRQYWRDLMELRTELQELMEQHRNEAKIASLFRDETEAITGK